jgi:hypothetical protein
VSHASQNSFLMLYYWQDARKYIPCFFNAESHPELKSGEPKLMELIVQ